MIAIAGGLAAALSFAVSPLCATRASRLIGPAPVLAWVAIVGLALSAGVAAAQRPVPTAAQAGWLAIADPGRGTSVTGRIMPDKAHQGSD